MWCMHKGSGQGWWSVVCGPGAEVVVLLVDASDSINPTTNPLKANNWEEGMDPKDWIAFNPSLPSSTSPDSQDQTTPGLHHHNYQRTWTASWWPTQMQPPRAMTQI